MKNSNFYRLKFVVINSFVFLVIIASAPAATHLVPADYPTIQSAIDYCNNGDVVIVSPGIYTGNGNRDIDFLGKTITVRSVNGPENCIIDCENSGSGFRFYNGEDQNSILDGFTITNADFGGISCRNSSPAIYNCIVCNCSHGGIYFGDNSYPTISKCIITNNRGPLGGGITCVDTNATIDNCLITGNKGGDIPCGIYCRNSDLTISNSVIYGNIKYGIFFRGNRLTVNNCILWGNTSEQILDWYSIISVKYSNVEGGWRGLGNIDCDPCFVQEGFWDSNGTPDYARDDFWVDGNYHLMPTSLCINSGDPDYYSTPDETDLDGNPRIQGGRIDMGVYEHLYIESYVKITPANLNPESKGRWVKAHFILPQEYKIDDVDINKPAEIWPFGVKSDSVDAFINDENLVEIVASFKRSEICSYISGEQILSLMCVVFGTNGEYFYGIDDVVIKNRHFEELSKFALYWLSTDCKNPDWCGGLDLNMDGKVNFTDFAMLADNCFVGME